MKKTQAIKALNKIIEINQQQPNSNDIRLHPVGYQVTTGQKIKDYVKND